MSEQGERLAEGCEVIDVFHRSVGAMQSPRCPRCQGDMEPALISLYPASYVERLEGALHTLVRRLNVGDVVAEDAALRDYRKENQMPSERRWTYRYNARGQQLIRHEPQNDGHDQPKDGEVLAPAAEAAQLLTPFIHEESIAAEARITELEERLKKEQGTAFYYGSRYDALITGLDELIEKWRAMADLCEKSAARFERKGDATAAKLEYARAAQLRLADYDLRAALHPEGENIYPEGRTDGETPPVRPGDRTGYIAGTDGYGASQAWGLTPEAAVRRWRRTRRRMKRLSKAARVQDDG